MGTDLLIVGGGPAGCAAAVMASSVGMRSVLIESGDALCGALRRIPVVRNVLTATNGPDLAAAIEADLAQCDQCRVELGRRATLIDAFDDRVEVTVEAVEPAESPGSDRAGESRLTVPYVVVATGVGPLGPEGAGWLGGAAGWALPQLWEADPDAIDDRTVLVLGADRPLGTVARAHPEFKARFVVAYPPEDAYKTEEIRRDPRVELVAVRRLELGPDPGPGSASAPVTAEVAPVTAEIETVEGERRTLTADLAFLNLGSAPAPPVGAVATDRSGYCPPGSQHPRVFTAGDLRSVRFQRIATAMGSGGEAALGAYYASRGLPTETGGPPTEGRGPPGPTGGD
ncbi:FAD-dependent oxidoreductase [Streptomyces javensis]